MKAASEAGERMRELYRSRRAAGFCGKCGGLPAPGRARCRRCLAIATKTAQQFRNSTKENR